MKFAIITIIVAFAATLQAAPNRQANRLWEQLQAKYDSNDDGTISAPEFDAAVAAAAEDLQEAVLDKYDVLLVADEVVTGFGRLGSMFGSDHYGMRPDLITVANWGMIRRARRSFTPKRPTISVGSTAR